jgi:hypothetical protein
MIFYLAYNLKYFLRFDFKMCLYNRAIESSMLNNVPLNTQYNFFCYGK